jgi:hypothetical protein
MWQIFSSEAKCRSASQEIPSFYGIYKIIVVLTRARKFPFNSETLYDIWEH